MKSRSVAAFLLAVAVVAWVLVPPRTPVAAVNQTYVGNANYQILVSDKIVSTSVAFSAARTWTLPAAGGFNSDQLVILDPMNTITATNTLTITPQSGENINGGTASLVVSSAGARVLLIPQSGTNWTVTVVGKGSIGQVISSVIADAAAVALTSTTAADVTTITLTPGDWSCRGTINRKLAASTSVTLLKTSISQTTATSGSIDTGTMVQWATAANVMAAHSSMTIGPLQQVVTADTAIFLVAQDTFSVSTNSGYGQLVCRRER